MIRLYTILALSGLISACAAAIDGRVYDTSGTTPLCSAAVRLEKGNSKVFTDTEGKFSIDIASTGIGGIRFRHGGRSLQAAFHGRTITASFADAAIVELFVGDLSGKQVFTSTGPVRSGTCSFVVPLLANGVFAYAIKAGGGTVTSGYMISRAGLKAPGMTEVTPVSARFAGYKGAISDIIEIRKSGYLTHRSIVTNSDTAGILIKLVPSAATATDAGGNIYEAVTIGTHTWMTENLRTTRYNDGGSIPTEKNNNNWSNMRSAAYCWYEHDSISNNGVYGALYNWYAVETGKLAPEGWHVAADSEWSALVLYYGGEEIAGGKLKKEGTTHWNWPGANAPGTDEDGFSALPGGFRAYVGTFTGINLTSYWWTSSGYNDVYAWSRCVGQGNRYVSSYTSSKWLGFSVRCVKD